jgi:hypothetical protein
MFQVCTSIIVQFRERMTCKEVDTELFLDFAIDPYEIKKELRDNKGKKENPMIKHALTEARVGTLW